MKLKDVAKYHREWISKCGIYDRMFHKQAEELILEQVDLNEVRTKWLAREIQEAMDAEPTEKKEGEEDKDA